ncbi:MAG: nitrophenyl compound nitroreductase subunit ArsF family protein [Bacteroidales bacterium]|nr:nitrophenyl compound nitroreductase subunit ArsF family protein [Bacteroidales bacterium]
MKRVFSIFIFVLLATSMYAASKVEVYYFHYTRRCVTCQAVEAESQKIISTLYAKEMKEDKIKFIGVNLDAKNSKAIARKCKAEGQALLVISGNKRIDLTEEGFMYAKTKPEKLKAELKKVIDPLLK